VIQLEDALGQVRKAYEMLRIEFEQTLAAHEQTGMTNNKYRIVSTSIIFRIDVKKSFCFFIQ